MLPKITFGNNSISELESQCRQAATEFSQHSSYGGQAIHFYGSYRELLLSPQPALPASRPAVLRRLVE